MKKFNELTTEQKGKRLKSQYYGLETCKFLSIIAPFVTIGIINFDDYFTSYNGAKMSIGCTLAMFVCGIAMWNEVRTSEGKTAKKISGVVGWAVALALVYLLNTILQDLLLIVFAGFIGQLVGAGFELGANSKLELSKKYGNANIESDALAKAITTSLKKKKENNDETDIGGILG